MTDQQHVPHPTLADICREVQEIKKMVQVLLERNDRAWDCFLGKSSPLPPPEGENNPPPAPSQEGNTNALYRQPVATRQYIEKIVIPRLKAIGVQSKAEAERMLYGFCLVKKFEELTQAQAEAFYIHVQENSEDPPGLWKLKP